LNLWLADCLAGDNKPRKTKKGRAFRGVGSFGDGDVLDDPVDMSFLLFTGACIETWNIEREDGERRCTYYEIFYKENGSPQGQRYPYRYPKVSDELFDKLVKSNFPPPLLAVAISEVIPLNFLAKGERYSFSKNVFAAKVQELKDKCACQHCRAHLLVDASPANQLMLCPSCGQETRIQPGIAWFDVVRKISDAQFKDDTLGKTKTFTDLKGDGESYGEAYERIIGNTPDENVPDIYADIDARNGWFEPDEKPQTKSSVKWNPKNRVPGTKVQNIEFHGGWKISRRMASYWRKNCAAEYQRCCDFILALLKKPWPRAPSLEGMAQKAPLFNALLLEDLKCIQKSAMSPRQT
jgi:transcription elongation factor Elf1